MKIDNINIGTEFPPFIIAEMSGNHNQSLERALKIVEAAADAGVDAIKLQTYTADTITLDVDANEFKIDDPESLWKGKSLYALYQQAYTPWEWHKPIMEHARARGLICFSSPFDESAIDFLESIDTPAYKIASFENNHLPLIARAASTGKPIIISSGMASIAELDEAVMTAREHGCNDLILLKCTSSYPAAPVDCNIRTIPHLKKLFNSEVGLSDHTLGTGVAIAAVALGAAIIEKHFTLSRKEGGPDSAFSMEPDEMRNLVRESHAAWMALGEIHYGPTQQEKRSLMFKRSLYVTREMKKGDVITEETVRCVRPGKGMAPKYYKIVLGKRVNCDIKKGTPLDWVHLMG